MFLVTQRAYLCEDREDVLEPLSGCVKAKEEEAVGVV